MDTSWLSQKAMQTLDENAKRRNNALHNGGHVAPNEQLALGGETMKICFEKEDMA